MDEKKLFKLIENGESERVEFKTSLSEQKEVVKTIAVYSWAKGGIVLIGISKSKIIGVEIGKGTIEKLANDIKQNTEPKLYPSIQVFKINNKNIILVKVEKVTDEPVFAFGRAYKRIGKSTHKLSREEYKRIIRQRYEQEFDSQICKKATLKDIDWDFVKDFFVPRYESLTKRKITGSDKELLEALGCIKHNKPTNGGILLFGKDPQKFFMNAYIALARYKENVESTERLDYKEFLGNLFQQIDNCDKYIKEHIAIMSRLLPHRVEREDIPEYCWFSVRELITNAVCHRDYSEQGSKVIIKLFNNRIEYYNPGGLPNWINPQNITEKQYSRNPIIAKVLAKIKYIEEVGEGWNKIIDEHKKHALKPKLPRISADGYTFTVNIFSTKEKFEKGRLELNERQKKAIEYTRNRDKITNAEYQKINKITKKTATRDLQDLVKREILIKKGRTGKGVYYILNPIYKGDIRGHKGT